MKVWGVKPASGSLRMLTEALQSVEKLGGTVHSVIRFEEKQFEPRWEVIYYTEIA